MAFQGHSGQNKQRANDAELKLNKAPGSSGKNGKK